MMKTKIILMLMILSAQQSFAQILKEIGNRAADAVERTVSDRVDRESSEKTDEAQFSFTEAKYRLLQKI